MNTIRWIIYLTSNTYPGLVIIDPVRKCKDGWLIYLLIHSPITICLVIQDYRVISDKLNFCYLLWCKIMNFHTLDSHSCSAGLLLHPSCTMMITGQIFHSLWHRSKVWHIIEKSQERHSLEIKPNSSLLFPLYGYFHL